MTLVPWRPNEGARSTGVTRGKDLSSKDTGIEFWTSARAVYTFHLSVISPVPSREVSELIYLDLTILLLHH